MSACAREKTRNDGKLALMFIGRAERSGAKPACISPEIERQRARRARSVGRIAASGLISCRYSPIARLFQIVSPSWRRHGTSIEGDKSSSSARVAGSSSGAIATSKSSPDILVSSQPRKDQDE